MAELVISDTPKVVVGLDFGTTFSGFAYAHRSAPEDVQLVFNWPDETSPYCKTQTSLYYDSEGNLVDWGWPALSKHVASLQQSKSQGCFSSDSFHVRFKLQLADAPPDDCQSTRFTAEQLVVDYLRCISVFATEELKRRYGKTLSKREIQWCLTVPAIWSQRSKEKMQVCAEKAEMVKGKHCSSSDASIYPLRIILEPEAASFCCQGQLKSLLSTGDLFVVADIGGGTIDVVVHKKAGGMNVREASASSGQLGGGTFVDSNFFGFLNLKIGCYKEFCKNNPETSLKILKWWLSPEGKMTFDGTGDRLMQVPWKLSKAWAEHEGSKVSEKYFELKISEEQMRAIFATEIEKVVNLVRATLGSRASRIKYIFLVGGFAESPYLVRAVKERLQLQGAEVLVPPSPGAAICKGAVSIGFGSGVVMSRISKMHYGIGACHPFRTGVDPLDYKFTDDDGAELCRNIFSVYVKKGESVDVDSFVTHSYLLNCNQWELELDMFCSSEDDVPIYTTDTGCMKMDEYSLDINEDLHLGKNRGVELSMYFGRSSIEVSGRRINFGKSQAAEKLYSVEFEAETGYRNK